MKITFFEMIMRPLRLLVIDGHWKRNCLSHSNLVTVVIMNRPISSNSVMMLRYSSTPL
jgi:hypothetical protein